MNTNKSVKVFVLVQVKEKGGYCRKLFIHVTPLMTTKVETILSQINLVHAYVFLLTNKESSWCEDL